MSKIDYKNIINTIHKLAGPKPSASSAAPVQMGQVSKQPASSPSGGPKPIQGTTAPSPAPAQSGGPKPTQDTVPKQQSTSPASITSTVIVQGPEVKEMQNKIVEFKKVAESIDVFSLDADKKGRLAKSKSYLQPIGNDTETSSQMIDQQDSITGYKAIGDYLTNHYVRGKSYGETLLPVDVESASRESADVSKKMGKSSDLRSMVQSIGRVGTPDTPDRVKADPRLIAIDKQISDLNEKIELNQSEMDELKSKLDKLKGDKDEAVEMDTYKVPYLKYIEKFKNNMALEKRRQSLLSQREVLLKVIANKYQGKDITAQQELIPDGKWSIRTNNALKVIFNILKIIDLFRSDLEIKSQKLTTQEILTFRSQIPNSVPGGSRQLAKNFSAFITKAIDYIEETNESVFKNSSIKDYISQEKAFTTFKQKQDKKSINTNFSSPVVKRYFDAYKGYYKDQNQAGWEVHLPGNKMGVLTYNDLLTTDAFKAMLEKIDPAYTQSTQKLQEAISIIKQQIAQQKGAK